MSDHTKKINGLGSIILNICNVFNFIVLIGRNINFYYGNKVLFSDIYLNFLMKNGRLRKVAKNFNKKEVNASISGLLNKSIINNIMLSNKMSSNNANNIQLINYRNNSSLNPLNFLDNKSSKKSLDYKISRSDIFKFYIYPYCLMKKITKLYQIKEQISNIFSIENFFDALQISNSSQKVLYEKILKHISNDKYVKTASRVNELKSDINLKNLYKSNNEFRLESNEPK